MGAWREELAGLHARIAPRFARPEVRERARRYLMGLPWFVGRRTGWQMSEKIGDGTPDGAQRLLNKARWDSDLVRDDLRDYVVERLGDPAGVLAVVETGFPKKGAKSAGVARQRNPTTGRVENCQAGLFLAYASPRGWAFIDRALYLPEEWAEDEERRREAGVPKEAAFATKGELARSMLGRAFRAGLSLAWVTGGGSYGEGEELRRWLEAEGRSYLLGVSSSHVLWKRIDRAPRREQAELPPYIEESRSWTLADGGANRRWVCDREWVRDPLAYYVHPGWERWLLTGRSVVRPDAYSYYRAYAPEGTPITKLAQMAGTGSTVEEGLEWTKDEVGLDQYEVRRWDAWHRHVTLGLLAYAALAVARADAKGGE